MNGAINPARPFAISAMIILCMSFTLFFMQFARVLATSTFWKYAISVFGVLSMFSAMFVFTAYHDAMTIVSSLFGVFVVLGISIEVYKSNLNLFKIGGILCIVLLLLNNYIYYSQVMIVYLPLLQKITFAFVLVWVLRLNIRLFQKETY